MAKRYKVILAILFVFLVIVATVVVTGVVDIGKAKKKRAAQSNSNSNAVQQAENGDYTDLFTTNTDVALPVLKTTIPNIYFTMTQEGEVTFYQLADGALTVLPENGNFEVEAECGSELLPAVIHYVEKNGRTYGCGLFTNVLYPDVNLYEYGFFEVTDLFSGFGEDGDLLLMIDVESDRFYSNEKIFSEIFTLDEEHNTEHFLSENQRQPGIDARMRTDYKMFTNDILDQGDEDNVLFFSSRYYVSYEDSGDVDILTSGGDGENIDNNKFATGLASLNFWRVDDAVYFFEKQEEGFRLVKSNGETVEEEDYDYDEEYYDEDGEVVTPTFSVEEIKVFEGSMEEDYLISGACILRKDSGEVYNVLTGKTSNVDYSGLDENFKPDRFVTSPNGNYCILRGANAGDLAAIVTADLRSGSVHSYTDDMFGYIASMDVTDNGAAVLSLSNGKSGTSFYQLIAML